MCPYLRVGTFFFFMATMICRFSTNAYNTHTIFCLESECILLDYVLSNLEHFDRGSVARWCAFICGTFV